MFVKNGVTSAEQVFFFGIDFFFDHVIHSALPPGIVFSKWYLHKLTEVRMKQFDWRHNGRFWSVGQRVRAPILYLPPPLVEHFEHGVRDREGFGCHSELVKRITT